MLVLIYQLYKQIIKTRLLKEIQSVFPDSACCPKHLLL